MRAFAFVLAGLAASAAQAAPHYGVTFLETPGGAAMEAFGLNNSGDVVGGAGQGDQYQAYLRTESGSYVALGGLGGTRSTAVAISDNGTIAGQGRTGSTGATSIPFIRYGDGPLNAIPLPAGGDNAIALGVNDAGIVVGSYRVLDSNNRPVNQGFRWNQAAGFETLASVDGKWDVTIEGVNASGAAVGNSYDFDGSAFRWNVDGSITLLEKHAAVPGQFDNYAYANAINDAGLVTGSILYDAPGESVSRMAIWGADNHLLRTASLDGWTAFDGSAINTAGDVAGYAGRLNFGPDGSYLGNEYIAVLWRAGEDPIDLNTLVDLPDWKLEGVQGINDRGQIIAYGFRDGIRFDVLLAPGGQGVPEPASWAMMIAGFGLAGSALRRRQGARVVWA